MILAIPEYDAAPTDPAQWDRYYDLTLDMIRIQVLPITDPSYPNWVEMARGAAVRESMRIIDTLVKSKYAARDYQTFLDEIVAYIAEKWGSDFNNFMASEPAIMLAQYVAAALDQMSWNLDRETDEWYMTLARLRESVAEGARILGYRAAPAVAASIDELVTLPFAPYAFDVPLREGHQFQGPNGLIFTLDSDQVIPAGDTEKLCTVYQGQKFLETFTSDGNPNQVFKLSLVPKDDFLAQGYVKVTAGGTEWTEFDFIPYSATESYEVHYLANPPRCKFGDGIIGKVPPRGSEIRIGYISTSGKRGRLTIKDSVKTSLTPVVINFQTIPITCTNPEPASSGDDAETQASIKVNGPAFFDTADRCVTKKDVETLAGHFNDPLYGAVAKANALSIRGVAQDLQLRALLDAILADKDDMTIAMEIIRTEQNKIKAATGSSSILGTIRNLLETIGIKTLDISNVLSTAMVDHLTAVANDIGLSKNDIDDAKTQLKYVSFCELLGQGDGVNKIFSGVLAKKPVTKGTFGIFVADKTPTANGNDGDCDSSPGEMDSSSASFVPLDAGKLIKIGGEYRQILKYKSPTTIEYSGPRIYGTNLLWAVYPPAIIGYDDGSGNVQGSGIVSGSVTPAGAWDVEFAVAPAGIVGQYGVPIVCTYAYQCDGVIDTLDLANGHCDDAIADITNLAPDANLIVADLADIDATVVSIGGKCDEIDTSAGDSIDAVDSVLYIPVQIGNDITAVYNYLDEVISGECKANIVRISCLVYDSNGFYTAPSNSLMNALKTYLTNRRVETVRYSVVSGAYYLLMVNMTIQLKITDQYVFTEVAGRVQAAIDIMFKGRAYAQGLLRSEYYKKVQDNVGIDYFNVNIDGSSWADPANTEAVPVVDSAGNLFVGENQVITRGTINIVQIF